jgi:sec-independent protein translocase protein TatA
MSGITSGIVLAFGTLEIVAVSLVVLLLFGTRLPAVMRSLGLGITEFKKGLKGDELTDPNATIEDKRREEEVTRR